MVAVALPAGRQVNLAEILKIQYYTYIIVSKKDYKCYTGITDNIERRLKQHCVGNKATISTLKRGPFELLFVQVCKNRIEARKLEKYLKSGIGREIRKELFKI